MQLIRTSLFGLGQYELIYQMEFYKLKNQNGLRALKTDIAIVPQQINPIS